jgi:hypothetical protein
MNDLQFSGRYRCLPIRCSGRLISLHNEHYIYWVALEKDAKMDVGLYEKRPQFLSDFNPYLNVSTNYIKMI